MKFFNLKTLKALKAIDLAALMAGGRQCGVAFVIAGAVDGFLGTGFAAEAFLIGAFGLSLLLVNSIQISGGNTK